MEDLARDACVVVTDLYPAFFIPRMQRALAARLAVRLEAVDANGLLPLAAAPRTFTAAYHFRRFLQKNLGGHLLEAPAASPLDGGGFPASDGIPAGVGARWPAASDALLRGDGGALGRLPIDHDVPPVSMPSGPVAARARLHAFLDDGLPRYGEERNHPDSDAASGLSPYLHWGHLSAHEVVHAVLEREGWSPARLATRADGKREGWWGVGPSAEAFLDELVTWREIGFVQCWHVPDHEDYDTLPAWARETLAEHAADAREHAYTYEQFRDAETHDELWNAAQRQLRTDGVIHNYLRMLWGKKILEWTEHPRDALRVMTRLEQPLRRRRAGSELRERDLLGAGPFRPWVAGARGVREGALDELGVDEAKGTTGALHGAVGEGEGRGLSPTTTASGQPQLVPSSSSDLSAKATCSAVPVGSVSSSILKQGWCTTHVDPIASFLIPSPTNTPGTCCR